MTDQLESNLRRGLDQIGIQPGPPDLTDQALAGARRVRRRRLLLAAAAAVALAGVSIPLLPHGRGGPAPTPVGVTPATPSAPAPCQSITLDATPLGGVALESWPEFVRVVIPSLPPRSDYTLQYASITCTGVAPKSPNAYAVINLGASRENGYLTIRLYFDSVEAPNTCAEVPTPAEDLLFCDEATATGPMVIGVDLGSNFLIVTAVYHDHRMVSIEVHTPAIGIDVMRTVVNDPDLARLAG